MLLNKVKNTPSKSMFTDSLACFVIVGCSIRSYMLSDSGYATQVSGIPGAETRMKLSTIRELSHLSHTVSEHL